MFSKEESKKIRQEFWIKFGEDYPRKWLLYNTKIKELSLKFTFTTKIAQVSIDVDCRDELIRAYYYDKIWSLEKIIKTEYIPEIILEPEYEIEFGKLVSKAYVELEGVSIHNKSTWEQTTKFLHDKMDKLEMFFYEFEDFIKA